MNDDRLHALDELRVTVTILEEATGLPLDLAGLEAGDFTALVGQLGEPAAPGVVDIVDAAAGKVRVTFQEGSLVVPSSLAQLRLSKGGETQTVWSEQYAVAPALAVAP